MTQSLEFTAATVESQQPENLQTLAVLWARKYYLSVASGQERGQPQPKQNLTETTSIESKKKTANKLMQKLNLASAKAWSLTESLLGEEIQRQDINPELINPLEIATDTRELFQKALDAYASGIPPQRLSVMVGRNCGLVRQKYTSVDPRAIGFVSMQFHYTGQKLLEWLTLDEQKVFAPYLKVMDDHMYMPLQAAYEAAAQHDEDSPLLLAVQHLLPLSTKIACEVCQSVSRQHPNYQSYSGALTAETVKISSIRDVEMFQVYLCLCVLDRTIYSVQQQLFPLCVMLYPCLKVSWTLVQEMLLFMSWEIQERLPLQDVPIFHPYLRIFSEMFSQEVFQNE